MIEAALMSKTFTARAVILASLVFASVAVATAQTAPPSRVTIKGRGNEVWIERSEKPIRKSAFGKEDSSGEVIGEAIRMKTQGADDIAVVNYLRRHVAELPTVIGAAEARQLHKVGAGEAVMAYLATESAIDIGEAGEGSANRAVYEQSPTEPGIGYGAASPYGYFAVPGYGASRGIRPPVRIARRLISRPAFSMPLRANRRFPR
jgi:hypothetical protein